MTREEQRELERDRRYVDHLAQRCTDARHIYEQALRNYSSTLGAFEQRYGADRAAEHANELLAATIRGAQ